MFSSARSSCIAALFGLLLSSCSAPDEQTADCHSAALAQAIAELELSAALLEHTQEASDHVHNGDTEVNAHEADEGPPALGEEVVLAARIDVIIAEAETRKACA